MGILCVFCVYDTIGNRCFEKTSFPLETDVLRKHRFQKKHQASLSKTTIRDSFHYT